MQNFAWNPVYNEIMRLKAEYLKLNSSGDIYDPEGSKTCVDKWILATNDHFWAEIRPFLVLKQLKSVILFKYGNLAILGDLAAEKGLETPQQLWEAWGGFLTYCRSISIDLEKEVIVTAPFDKFFNIDELPSTSWEVVKGLMDKASSIEFSNKLDGSICICRYIGQEEDEGFFVTTSGSLDANEEKASVLRDVKHMFFDPNNENSTNLRRMVQTFPQYTFMFEYIAVNNRIVVKYSKEEEGLYLIGIRNIYTGECFNYQEILEIASNFNVKATSVFNEGLNEIMELIKTKKSDEMEGFVINVDGHLFKLKTDDYVKIHRILAKISAPNVIIQAIADGIYDDLLAKVPEAYREEVGKIATVVVNYEIDMAAKVQEYYDQAPKKDKKEFMIWVTDNVPSKYQGAVRNKFLGKENNFLKQTKGAFVSYTRMKEIDPHYMDKLEFFGGEE